MDFNAIIEMITGLLAGIDIESIIATITGLLGDLLG